MANKEVQMTLKEAVAEVLGSLNGLDLEYNPAMDRFHSCTRALNRGLRAVALEKEWSYYSTTEEIGTVEAGMVEIEINSSLRPRQVNDDAVRLVDDNGITRSWVKFLPRDALGKYIGRRGLWCSITRNTLSFSRPLSVAEVGLHILCPVMREPKMFRLPEGDGDVPPRILNQPIDFDYPDLVICRAAMYIADTDPVMQPRVPTLEARYKDIMYALSGRDEESTDAVVMDDFQVPIGGSLTPVIFNHHHPHSAERYR